jgi:hypothetical protein
MTRMSMPASSRAARTNSPPFCASRTALVATATSASTLWRSAMRRSARSASSPRRNTSGGMTP